SQFISDNLAQLERISYSTSGIAAIIGFVDASDDLYNAAAFLSDGKRVGVYYKNYLPNYSVFDENRYFKEGRSAPVFFLENMGIGVNICEDIWYPNGPAVSQARAGAEIIINISASPYRASKRELREKMLSTRAADNLVALAYVNIVGGQDELVFDGDSVVFNERGELIARGKQFEEDFIVLDLNLESVFRTRLHDPRRRKERITLEEEVGITKSERIEVPPLSGSSKKPRLKRRLVEPLGPVEEIHDALVLGTRDYVKKNGFKKVVVGLSGGIDSSLVAALATEALGNQNVVGVSMPSRFTSEVSNVDARIMAESLGIQHLVIPIEEVYKSYLSTLKKPFEGTATGVAEENIQARIRGNLLMALSNKFGWLLLTTGNKSEYATGYCTLYGDMAGGFALIKDVQKTQVYKLGNYINDKAGKKIIPERSLTREPTAELRANQKDSDTLPPYAELDPILELYVEEDKSPQEIIASGYKPEVVARVVRMVDGNEYKRRQAPPGIKISPRAFGKDRRLPITSKYKSI
ncbi:MAG: NAD+ synthase, partial [Dehalococcoidia bacterium]|nr:NAD+ synthase [Dehalococcoidia bacterium]